MSGNGMLRLLAVLSVCAVAAPAANGPDRNGASWNGLSHLQKGMYVVGVIDGTFGEIVLADPGPGRPMHVFLEAQTKMLVRADGRSPSGEEIVAAVDAFYRLPQNISVCNIHAVRIEWLSLTGNGLSERDIALYRKQDGRSGCP